MESTKNCRETDYIGAGRKARAMNPIKEPAQWTPSASYILTVNSGRTTPKMDRMTVFPARAEAE